MELEGQTFGYWLVLEKRGENQWLCRCRCGTEKEVPESWLLSGVSKSCGCRPDRAINLTGRRFGRLTVLEPLEKRASDRSINWRCRCDCGKELVASSNNLRQNHYSSCGCMQITNAQNSKTFVDGTCVEILLSEKIPTNNTSGCKGVYRNGNKWQAYINYAGKRQFLGKYDRKEDAIRARKSAETRLRRRVDSILSAGA